MSESGTGTIHAVTTRAWDEIVRSQSATVYRLSYRPTGNPHAASDLDALAPGIRAAVLLCDIEGLTHKEVASTLGIGINAARTRICRGRAQLHGALADTTPPYLGERRPDAAQIVGIGAVPR